MVNANNSYSSGAKHVIATWKSWYNTKSIYHTPWSKTLFLDVTATAYHLKHLRLCVYTQLDVPSDYILKPLIHTYQYFTKAVTWSGFTWSGYILRHNEYNASSPNGVGGNAVMGIFLHCRRSSSSILLLWLIPFCAMRVLCRKRDDSR